MVIKKNLFHKKPQRTFSLAKDKKFDVVLIDTAGRMQNDEPLMIALAKVKKTFFFFLIKFDFFS